MVRADPPTNFAVEIYLHTMIGLRQPTTNDRLKLPPREIVERAIELFFGGLPTSAGRKEHENLFPR